MPYEYLVCTYTKKFFVVCLKFKSNCISCVLSGDPSWRLIVCPRSSLRSLVPASYNPQREPRLSYIDLTVQPRKRILREVAWLASCNTARKNWVGTRALSPWPPTLLFSGLELTGYTYFMSLSHLTQRSTLSREYHYPHFRWGSESEGPRVTPGPELKPRSALPTCQCIPFLLEGKVPCRTRSASSSQLFHTPSCKQRDLCQNTASLPLGVNLSWDKNFKTKSQPHNVSGWYILPGNALWSPQFLAASLHKPKLGNACPSVVPHPLSAEFTLLALWPGLINEQNNTAKRPTRCLEMRNKCVSLPRINLWLRYLHSKF